MEISKKNPLLLAFVGDAVMSQVVRAKLVEKDLKVSLLHTMESTKVCARAQSQKFEAMRGGFSEIEEEIAHAALNKTPNTLPKNCTQVEYRRATALEAVIGYNFLMENHDRVKELCE